MKINEVNQIYTKLLNNNITINGWILTVRNQKDVVFIKLNDGSNSQGIQLVVNEKLDNLDKLNIGTSISATGVLIESPAKGQLFELNVKSIKIYGLTNLDDYPLAKGKLPLDYLRNYLHLRTRTSTFGSVFRIKSAISSATHDFFKKKNYLYINPNIITINECEGGAGVFQITENDISELKEKHDWLKDHFNKPAYLTVSSQLQLEALACSLGAVYTTNKSFRSEHSSTSKHLSEFEHLEIEDIFINLDELMQIGEDYIKYVGNYLLENSLDDINNLDKFVSKGLLERINIIIKSDFKRLKYDDAIELLKTVKLSKAVIYGDDLSSEMENYLTEHFKSPVFVYNWPLAIKSFYMKQSENNELLCENFDLLMPYKIGELIGGSIREDNLDKMTKVMNERNINLEPLQFYLDLRKYGTVPHGGFGLGLDRMTMMFTGMESIKDVVAFPVYYQHCCY